MGSTINLKAADGFTLSAYTAGPTGGTKGIVVIQEIFGVNHHMRDMCDRFAAEGYAVCAPAIFDRAERGVELGYAQEDIDKGRAYRMKLDDAKVIFRDKIKYPYDQLDEGLRAAAPALQDSADTLHQALTAPLQRAGT